MVIFTAVFKATKSCGPNVPFTEIGATIQRHAAKNGLTVLPAFLGHGIGEYFHGPPDIYHTSELLIFSQSLVYSGNLSALYLAMLSIMINF